MECNMFQFHSKKTVRIISSIIIVLLVLVMVLSTFVAAL